MPHALTAAVLLAVAGLPVAAAPLAPPGPTAVAASAPPGVHARAMPISRPLPRVVEEPVDINSAGRNELTTLPGVGPAEADRIIANRPYLTKTELVTKQVLLVGPYMSLKNRVVAMQKFKRQ